MTSVGSDTKTQISRSFHHSGTELVQELQLAGRLYRSVVTVRGNTGDPLGDWWQAYLKGERPRAQGSETGATLRVAELFCGAGGLALGFGQAAAELGYHWVSSGAADTDADAVAVYRRNHQTRFTTSRSVSMLVDYHITGQGDCSQFTYEPEMVDNSWTRHVGDCDVLLAGPPCQGHSNLNNRTRRIDRRNELYLTVPAIAVATRARVVVIENVPAVVHDRKQVVQSTRRLLEDAGYHVEFGVLHAAAIGWPQRRDRFFIVARQDVPPLPLAMVEAALASDPRSLTWAIDGVTPANDHGFMHAQPNFSDENRRRIDWLFDNDAYDLPPAERPDCHRKGTTYTAVYGRLYPDSPAPTITTGFMTPGRGRYIHPTERRVLSPREAARLQGFPDTYDFRPDPPAEPSKAKLAKWIGDAVPMPLGYLAALAALGPGWS